MFDPGAILTETEIRGPKRCYILCTGNSLTYFPLSEIRPDDIVITVNATGSYYPGSTYHVIGDLKSFGKHKSNRGLPIIAGDRAPKMERYGYKEWYLISELISLPKFGGGHCALGLAYVLAERVTTLKQVHYVGLDFSFYERDGKEYYHAHVLREHSQLAQRPVACPDTDHSSYTLKHQSEAGRYTKIYTGVSSHYGQQCRSAVKLARASPAFLAKLVCRSHFDLALADLTLPDAGFTKCSVSVPELLKRNKRYGTRR